MNLDNNLDNPSLAPVLRSEQPALAESDECIRKLAALVESKDPSKLDEVARLIGRLLVPLE